MFRAECCLEERTNRFAGCGFPLGAICIGVATAGLCFPTLPAEAVLLVDASAKLAIGVWLFSDLFRHATHHEYDRIA
jgi:hypothetical protein